MSVIGPLSSGALGEQSSVIVTLFSNASLEVFPENRLARFSNLLARPIRKSPRTPHLYARLRRLTMHGLTKRIEWPRTSRDLIVELRLKQAKPQLFGEIRVPILASFNLAKEKRRGRSGNYVDIIFKKAPLVKMRSEAISHLSLHLSDHTGENFPLGDGQPTVAQLEISAAMDERGVGAGGREERLLADELA